MCGELAGDPAAALLLVGLGVTELSMTPALIPEVKAALRGVDLATARRAAQAALTAADAQAARALSAALLWPCPPLCCDSVRRPAVMYSFRPVDAGTLSGLRSSRTLAAGTSLRMVAAPVVMALLLAGSYDASAIVFALAAATDWFDGRLARRWGVASSFGAFLDTTADKVLVATALIGLVAVHRGSPWVALIIIGREFTILGLRLAVVSAGRSFQTSMAGKWKATVQFVAITLAMLRPDVQFAGAYLDQWLMVLAAVVTIWSGIDYVARFGATLKG